MCKICCPHLQTSLSPGRSSAHPGQEKKTREVILKTFHMIQHKPYSLYSCPRCGSMCVKASVCVCGWSSIREHRDAYTYCTYTHTLKITPVHKDNNGQTVCHNNNHANAAYTWSRTGRWGDSDEQLVCGQFEYLSTRGCTHSVKHKEGKHHERL